MGSYFVKWRGIYLIRTPSPLQERREGLEGTQPLNLQLGLCSLP